MENTTVHIWTTGDPSVGINPVSTEIDLGFPVDGETDKNEIECLLVECFSEIWGEPAYVEFQPGVKK